MVGIPLFPAEEGYYFTLENASRAAERYERWKRWSTEHDLAWDWVGLDIEPEARFYQQIMDNPWGLILDAGGAPAQPRRTGSRARGVRVARRAHP